MSTPDKKNINKRADKMESGWEQEAPTVKFRKISLEDLKAARAELAAEEETRANQAAQLKATEGRIDDLYRKIDDMMVEVGEGVRGHDDYGKDSLLYGLMGFIRKSLQKSGLTRKNKNQTNGEDK